MKKRKRHDRPKIFISEATRDFLLPILTGPEPCVERAIGGECLEMPSLGLELFEKLCRLYVTGMPL